MVRYVIPDANTNTNRVKSAITCFNSVISRSVCIRSGFHSKVIHSQDHIPWMWQKENKFMFESAEQENIYYILIKKGCNTHCTSDFENLRSSHRCISQCYGRCSSCSQSTKAGGNAVLDSHRRWTTVPPNSQGSQSCKQLLLGQSTKNWLNGKADDPVKLVSEADTQALLLIQLSLSQHASTVS